jgi:hypothetical protein
MTKGKITPVQVYEDVSDRMEFKIGERAIGHSSSLKFVPRQYI